MKNLNIIPLGSAGSIDEQAAQIGSPPYIIAEKKLVAYYSSLNVAMQWQVGVAVCPVRLDYGTLDVDSKSVGTYRKPPKNQFQKLGLAIALGGGGSPDVAYASIPTAVYNTKTKKFMVYYVAVDGGGVTTVCLASGYEPNQLVKHGIVLPSPPGTTAIVVPIVIYDKEEDLFKVYYTCTVGFGNSTFLATSRNGYDF